MRHSLSTCVGPSFCLKHSSCDPWYATNPASSAVRFVVKASYLASLYYSHSYGNRDRRFYGRRSLFYKHTECAVKHCFKFCLLHLSIPSKHCLQKTTDLAIIATARVGQCWCPGLVVDFFLSRLSHPAFPVCRPWRCLPLRPKKVVRVPFIHWRFL